jgi:hypothetical protein
MKNSSSCAAARWFLRVALSASYLSAVADRFGFWGMPGVKGVAWGSWSHFLEYTGFLNSFVPPAAIPALAIAATALEVIIPLGLLTGWRLQAFALASGALAAAFFATMILASGFKPPLDYSVFTVSAASFYLASTLRGKRLE